MNSRIIPLVRFNRRERLRKKFALYLLLVLLTTIVFEEGEKIVEICSASSTMTISNPMMVSSISPTGNESTAVVATAEGNSKDQSEVGEAKASPAPASIKELVAQTFGDQADNALKVMQCESQGQVDRIGDKQLPKPSIGLFQINTYYNPEYSSQRLTDPNYNIQVAHEIYLKGGWGRWTCGRRIIYNESI